MKICWECWSWDDEPEDPGYLLVPEEIARDMERAGIHMAPFNCDRCGRLGYASVDEDPQIVSDEDKAARVELMEKISS